LQGSPKVETEKEEKMCIRSERVASMALLAVVVWLLCACKTFRPSDGESQLASSIDPGPPLGVIEDNRVIFYKSELSVINPKGVLLNLVATNGGVGIRFYKDFGFGNEQVTHPWHMGWIEGKPGYEGLAILRDWAFTATLWDADGKLTVGRLDPYPPANPPAGARFHVRGTEDEVQAMVSAPKRQMVSTDQTGAGETDFAVRGDGNTVIGSRSAAKALILYDTADGAPYEVTIRNGRLEVNRLNQ
jgi:hypothetical protein